jgi:hypothetical protein
VGPLIILLMSFGLVGLEVVENDACYCLGVSLKEE